jgi:hypothetical protein
MYLSERACNVLLTILMAILVAGVFAITFGCGDGLRPAPMGEACEVADDCEDDTCLETFLYDFPGGYCTRDCWDDYGVCGADAVCGLLFTEKEGYCLVYCDTDDDCREEYECRRIGLRKACLPGAPE